MKSLRSLLHSIYEDTTTKLPPKSVLSSTGKLLTSSQRNPTHDDIVWEHHKTEFGFDNEAAMDDHIQNTSANPGHTESGLDFAMKRGYARVSRVGNNFWVEAHNASHAQDAIQNLMKLITHPNSIQIDTQHTESDDGQFTSDSLDHPRDIARYISSGPRNAKVIKQTWAQKNAWRLSQGNTEGISPTPPPDENLQQRMDKARRDEPEWKRAAESHDPTLPILSEKWVEYDVKVGETNTSLFEPGTNFDMKKFLRKLRKKHGLQEFLPGEK